MEKTLHKVGGDGSGGGAGCFAIFIILLSGSLFASSLALYWYAT